MQMSPTMRRKASFTDPLVESTVPVDMSPDTVFARGLDPTPLKLPPSASAPSALVWLKFRRTRMLPVIALLLCLLYAGSHAIDAVIFAVSAVASQPQLAGVAIAGFCAQLVDGSLGMGYGLTSSTILVASGLTPKSASACVHLAQLGTTLLSGASHHMCGTVDWPTTRRIAAPGVIGALVGTALLSFLSVAPSKNLSSGLLLLVGFYLFARFFWGREKASPGEKATKDSQGDTTPARRHTLLTAIGALGGFVDSTGGGGWGPVATSGLLAEGRLEPSQVIGTVSASEFLVTAAAVAGFSLASFADAAGSPHTELPEAEGAASTMHLMLTLLAGGLLAAPLAPLAVSRVPSRLLGVGVGGFIVATNARVLLHAAGVANDVTARVLLAIALVWASAMARVGFKEHAK